MVAVHTPPGVDVAAGLVHLDVAACVDVPFGAVAGHISTGPDVALDVVAVDAPLGADAAVDEACVKLKEAGARRALRLPVGGAFHSPLMEPARQELEAAIAEAEFMTPVCPVYQNVDAKPYTDAEAIKKNLIAQLTAPVRWTQIVENMVADGYTEFTEVGPGTVLQGLVSKVSREVKAESKSTLE